MPSEIDNYLVRRLDAFEQKLDNVFIRMEQKIDDHAQQDRAYQDKLDERVLKMSEDISGLKVKSGVFGIAGGLIASLFIYIQSHIPKL